MRTITLLRAAWRFAKGQQAAEVTELAIVLALIVAICVITIGLIGDKVAQMYADTEALI